MPPIFAYQPLSDDSVDSPAASLTDGKEEGHIECNRCTTHSRIRRNHWIAHAVSLIAIVSLLVLLIPFREGTRMAARCWDMYNYYSPVNSALATQPYITTRFNGSLWYDSPFKGPPTPAVEEAWHSIMQYGMIAVSAEDYEKVNHSVRTAVQFPTESGGGYMATTVGTHQLHCLHFLWQDHHRASFPDVLRKAQEVPELYERHFEHCVDYIRQSIMCQFDTGLVTYDWVLEHQNPTPNSNAMHKCVNWDVVQRWLQDRAVEIPEGFEWKQPEGQESLPWNP
ncbi:hypothetical protein F5B20DRAFT_562497 [Whalleya microplaca]|nr:hypothetical protein F5B20DRAFT_562497 [Whalleya microplaca]